MPDTTPRPPHDQPWENGWAPDTSRVPGTRRLWLAGTLAVATIAACVTTIAVTDRGADDASGAPESPADATLPGLISFASPSPSTTAPSAGRSGPPSAQPTTKAPSKHSSTPMPTPTPSAEPSKSSPPEKSSPAPSTDWRSVRAVNYPDRYWHMTDGYVALDRIASAPAAEDATFKVVKGLAKPSCYSFATADGGYLRHRNFVLRAERSDGSPLFHQDATFCPRPSAFSDAITLESVNYPGRFLRHRNFVLRLESYEHSDLYRQDSAFRVVAGLSD